MHYIGMAAMEGVTISYDHFLFALSILVAVLASMTAMKMFYELAMKDTSFTLFLYKLLSALVMGIAISGMHYIGMNAASFTGEMNHVHTGGIDLMTTAIIVSIFIVMIQCFLSLVLLLTSALLTRLPCSLITSTVISRCSIIVSTLSSRLTFKADLRK